MQVHAQGETSISCQITNTVFHSNFQLWYRHSFSLNYCGRSGKGIKSIIEDIFYPEYLSTELCSSQAKLSIE